ncbi:unknown protein [Seminavis robusta]|uniref:Uncharacterized protein n=1 Tax=Seminavis robusta TaxID=568900 RepID=A0A9N8EQ44_9STRA|nr:unknown protein [Seminavis robusta]|eukprot:Sro1643_g288100.1 n/a (340) ;mRNA; f:3959-4978
METYQHALAQYQTQWNQHQQELQQYQQALQQHQQALQQFQQQIQQYQHKPSSPPSQSWPSWRDSSLVSSAHPLTSTSTNPNNVKSLALKKLHKEAFTTKATEDTAMEIDSEPASDSQQIKDLVKKMVQEELKQTQKQIARATGKHVTQALNQQRNNNQNNNSSKNNRRGPAQGGASNNKKKSPHQQQSARGGRTHEEGPSPPQEATAQEAKAEAAKAAAAAGQDEEGEEEPEEEATLPPEAPQDRTEAAPEAPLPAGGRTPTPGEAGPPGDRQEIELTYGFVSDPTSIYTTMYKLDSFICRLVLLCQANQLHTTTLPRQLSPHQASTHCWAWATIHSYT